MIKTNKEMLRDKVLSRVMTAHRISRADLLGKCRDADLVSARKAVAFSLSEAGFSMRHIARILKRDYTTVRQYLGFRPGTRLALPSSLACFPEDVRETIIGIAKSGQTTPAVIITEWINERARFEASKTMEKAA
jgi:hypothetical protein